VENLSQRVTDLDRQLVAQVREAELLSNRVNDLETRLATQGKLLAERDYETNQLRQAREAADRAAQAAFAEEEGAMEEAQAVVNAPSVAVAEPVPDTYQRVSGVSKRDNWQAEVRNLKALCAAIAKGTVPVNYVLPNQQVLNARAKADRETMNVPGVVPVNNAIISGRSRT